MGQDINQVTLLGRVGKDPEINFLTSGRAVCKFSMATSKGYKKNGEWVETTHWHNIVVWGKTGEAANDHVRKGLRVLVTGSVETRSWEDKNTGKKLYTTEINATEVVCEAESLKTRDDHEDKGGGERKTRRSSSRRREEPAHNDGPPEGDNDEDIPF